jgi:hypothetical protein
MFRAVRLVNAITIQAWTDPMGSRRLNLPEFLDNRSIKVAKFSALGSGRFYLPEDTTYTHFCQRLNRPKAKVRPARLN